MDLELVEAIALEHRSSDANHPGTDLIDGEGSGLRWKPGSNGQQKDNAYNAYGAAENIHAGAHADDTGKQLKLLGSRASVVDSTPAAEVLSLF